MHINGCPVFTKNSMMTILVVPNWFLFILIHNYLYLLDGIIVTYAWNQTFLIHFMQLSLYLPITSNPLLTQNPIMSSSRVFRKCLFLKILDLRGAAASLLKSTFLLNEACFKLCLLGWRICCLSSTKQHCWDLSRQANLF